VYENCSGLVLSQRRAESVGSFLSAHGVHSERILAKGMGGDRPVTRVKESLSKNRRVEIHLVKS
jgi:outer membrane protein OmpA-like peptidoglycan-associated protein